MLAFVLYAFVVVVLVTYSNKRVQFFLNYLTDNIKILILILLVQNVILFICEPEIFLFSYRLTKYYFKELIILLRQSLYLE